MDQLYKRFAELVLSYQPDGLQHIEIHHKWFSDGDEEGPAVLFLNDTGKDLGNRMEDIFYDEFSELFHANSLKIKGSEPVNFFKEVIGLNGDYEVDLINDPLLDRNREAETREAIGDELYEKLEEERKNFKETEEEPAVPVDTLSIGQLLGIIKDDLSEAIPDGWSSLILKTLIGKEGDNQSIETHFFYQLDGKDIQFEPENPITSMNALLRIQERMAEEGNIWNKGTIIINRDGTVDIQVK